MKPIYIIVLLALCACDYVADRVVDYQFAQNNQ